MKFSIEIETENAAFEGFERERELARILRDVAERLEMRGVEEVMHTTVRDINGNKVGEIHYG